MLNVTPGVVASRNNYSYIAIKDTFSVGASANRQVFQIFCEWLKDINSVPVTVTVAFCGGTFSLYYAYIYYN